jgi:hypothetical protein
VDNVVPFLIVISPFAFVIGLSVLYRRGNERIARRNLPPDDMRRADDGSGYDKPGDSIGSWWRRS